MLITAFDAYAIVPFAQLRLENKAVRYAVIRLVGIALNIALNLLLILVLPRMGVIELRVENIFLSNVLSSALVMLILWVQARGIRLKADFSLWKKMIRYGWPILIAGTAGVINETMDRVFFKILFPEDIAENILGIYGNCFKMAIFITLFIQAFRFAAEPFFFSMAKDRNAPATYARVSLYFHYRSSGNVRRYNGQPVVAEREIPRPRIPFGNRYCPDSPFRQHILRTLLQPVYVVQTDGQDTLGSLHIYNGSNRDTGRDILRSAALRLHSRRMVTPYHLRVNDAGILYAGTEILPHTLRHSEDTGLSFARWAGGYISWYILDGNVIAGNAIFAVFCLAVLALERKSLMQFLNLKK